ncbi:MAG: PAS domain-containing protein [Rhodobacteraceae bacterium]|nr:MAG: PAS domain-containing protein [Paracoccaceae bacterium]
MSDIVRHVRLPLCITDPHQADNPIVFVNPAFSELTGYDAHEVVGQNCRFLQGPDTTSDSIQNVRGIIKKRSVDTVEIVNYRKDGTKFLNALQIGPILDEDGELLYHFGSQLDVTEKRALERKARELADEELFHRLRNVVNVMSVITRMTSKQQESVADFGQKITERLAALSTVHFSSSNRSSGVIGLAELTRSIVAAYAPIGELQIAINGPEVNLAPSLASPVSLALHELATNAVKYGSLGVEDGNVDVSWRLATEDNAKRVQLEWRETGGPEPKYSGRTGGTGIVKKIIEAAGGTLDLDWRGSGLVATLSVPVD